MSNSLESTFDAHQAIAAIRRADRRMAGMIGRVGAFTLQPHTTRSTFHALARSIVFQQLSGKAASTIFSRVLSLYPRRRVLNAREVAETPDERLRAAGLSRSKLASLKDLAAKTLDGSVPAMRQLREMDDEQIIQRLTQVRGIGVWTVEMLLIFYLARPDVMPATDLGIRKGLMNTYRQPDLPSPAEVLQIAEPWRPFRTVASWYLWRAASLNVDI